LQKTGANPSKYIVLSEMLAARLVGLAGPDPAAVPLLEMLLVGVTHNGGHSSYGGYIGCQVKAPVQAWAQRCRISCGDDTKQWARAF